MSRKDLRTLVWSKYSEKYAEPEDNWTLEICDRCDEQHDKDDPHGIEDCIRSLATRVKTALRRGAR